MRHRAKPKGALKPGRPRLQKENARRTAPARSSAKQMTRPERRGSVKPADETPPADMAPVRVFISYAHSDHVIAATLKDVLRSINPARVECFLDTESIEAGQGWEKKLESSLSEADWLVCVYTGEQSDYCGYEVGVFTQGRALTPDADDSRVVCLHDAADPPGLFRSRQNKLIRFLPVGISAALPHIEPAAWSPDEVKFYRESGVFKFLADFASYKDLYVAGVVDAERLTQTLLLGSKRITQAFDAARGSDVKSDTPTQLSLEVAFTAESPAPIEAIPNHATVTGTFGSFALFGLMPAMENRQLPSTTWGDLRTGCLRRSTANALWMESLEREMINAASGQALGTPEAFFSSAAGGKIYRPILTRHLVLYSGTNLFRIVFVETLPRQFIGFRTTSLLLAGLVQASRFRFSYLEEPDRVAARFEDSLCDRDFIVNCKQLRYDIERVRSEAVELGLLDSQAFIAAFGSERRALAESFREVWNKAKADLLPRLPVPGQPMTPDQRTTAKVAVATFLDVMAEENRRFVLATLDAYRDEVVKQK